MIYDFPVPSCAMGTGELQAGGEERETAQSLLPPAATPCHQLGDTSGTLLIPEQGQSPVQKWLHSFTPADLPAELRATED